MTFAALVIFAVFAAAFRLFRRIGASWDQAVVQTGTACGFGLLLATEKLSMGHTLHFVPLLALWTNALIVIVVATWIIRLNRQSAMESEPKAAWTSLERDMALLIALWLGVVALIALFAPPNNFDSMTYHMARVAHWRQNASVGHYPTNIDRQLYQSPFAEYVIVHLQILGDGDRFANLVQWLAWVMAVAAAHGTTLRLGASRRAALVAGALVVTIPMAILQASSTQNDLVAGAYLLAFVMFILDPAADRRATWLWAAMALALAIATKPTVLLFGLPFGLWGAYRAARAMGKRVITTAVLIAVVIAIANGPHWARNTRTYGDPLGGSEESGQYTNDAIGAASLYSNLIRNTAMQFATPWESVNRRLVDLVGAAHWAVGLQRDDARFSWAGLPYKIPITSRHEDTASNFLHTLLIAVAVVIALRRKNRSENPAVAMYALCSVAAFCIFCAVLKWQPWHSRLQLPFFIVAMPLVAATIATRLHRPAAVTALVGLLLVASLPFLVTNASRPLIGMRNIFETPREEQYFASYRNMKPPIRQTVRQLAADNCGVIAVKTGRDDYEYPLFPLLESQLGRRPVIRHVDVENASRRYTEPGDFLPCAKIEYSAGGRMTLTRLR